MHKGKIIAKRGKYKVINCEICGFKHLYPLPTIKDLSTFYQNKYYSLIKKGGRAPEIRKQISKKKKEVEAELHWLEHTLYEDIHYILEKKCSHKGEKYLLDIGCGTGVFMKYMKNFGWKVTGIEPSKEKRNKKEAELTIYNTTLEEFTAKYKKYRFRFDAITLLNVLEHIPNPIKFLEITKNLLKPQTGILCIRVPNDFNELQIYAEKKINKNLWWIAVPDHINYFSIKSLRKLIKSLNFKIIHISTDFPMETFLLMGKDYIDNPELGNLCHKKRVIFELSISNTLRRKFYQHLAKIGIGRNCIIFAKTKK